MVLISIITDIKNGLVLRYCKLKIFSLTENYFSKIAKFFIDKMLVRSKFFLQFVEKMEKIKLSLSKQHNKMLKIKSEMLKIKKCQNNQARKNFPGISEKFFENFSFPG